MLLIQCEYFFSYLSTNWDADDLFIGSAYYAVQLLLANPITYTATLNYPDNNQKIYIITAIRIELTTDPGAQNTVSLTSRDIRQKRANLRIVSDRTRNFRYITRNYGRRA